MLQHTAITKDNLPNLLGLTNSRIITLVGAGGKTSMMHRLAEAFTIRGYRTLVTTTTHIFRPSHFADIELLENEDILSLENAFHKSRLVGLGIPSSTPFSDGSVKWSSPSMKFLKQIADIPDIILCEGDGSRGFPVKLPRQQEPVFYPGTDTVIGVIGLSCLGQKTSDVLFGLEEYLSAKADSNKATVQDPLKTSKIPLKPSAIITSSFLSDLSLSPWGLKKNLTTESFHVVLNQADLLTTEETEKICACTQKIRDNKAHCHIVSLKNNRLFTTE